MRNRNVLGLSRGGSRTLGKPLGDAGPQHVGFAAHAPFDPGVEFVVINDGHARGKFGIGGGRAQPEAAPVVGVRRRRHEFTKDLVLCRQGLVAHGVQARNSAGQAPVYEVGDGREGHCV